ncbi:MAG: hypothetical protein JNK11_01625 [Alphaproteobacteria bacterium]|nr:hypothetical protein [Alphaproteobacteria bacterium]
MFERLLQGRASAASGFPEVPPALQAFHGNRMALRVFSDAADAVAVCRDVAPSLKQSIAQAQDLQARDFMRLTRQRIMESPLLEANERAALVADVDRNARSLSARYLGVGPRERTAFRDAALARTFGSGNAFDELKLRLRKQITNTTCLSPDARKAFDAAVRDMRGSDARALAEMAAAERIQTWYAARRSDPAEEVGELLMLSIAGEHCDWLSKRTRAAVDREALERAKIVAKARGLHHHEVLSAQREASYARYRQEGCGPAQRIAAERGFAMAAR